MIHDSFRANVPRTREVLLMVNRAQAVAPVMALILAGLAGCGAPTEPVVPTPAPTTPAVATPAPAPTPTPTPTATPGEAPVENTAPAVRVTIRLYAVEDGAGNFMPNWDPSEPIPTRFWARVDVTSKDEKGKETNGNGIVEFFLSNPRSIEVTGGHTNQRRLKALEPTMVDVWATQDGVQSNKLTLTFY
jgi:hypothetical protein